MSKKHYRTDILFPRTSMLMGAGSIFNLGGNYFEFNRSRSGREADNLALESDWGVVGDDLRRTISQTPKKRNLQKI